MKVNISLVGGQPFPVFAQALDAKPDILVLIHSERTKEQAMLIKKCVKNKLHATSVSLTEADAYDLKQSEITLEATVNAWVKPDNQVTVNIAGGTKPWGVQLYHLLLNKENVKCVFIDQNNKVWDMKSFQSHICDYSDIVFDDLIKLNGVTSNYNIFNHDDDDIANKIEQLYLCNRTALYDIIEKINDEEINKKNVVCKKSSGQSEIWRNGVNDFDCHIVSYNKKYFKDYHISSPNAKRLLLNTGWFEHKVACILAKWYDAKRVFINAEFNLANKTYPANEIDIIVETKNGKYLFVECKTKVHEPTDIDKFNTAVKTYGGLGSKRIFVTFDPMAGLAKDKCETLKIPDFSTNEIKRKGEKQFFDALDREMATINAR